jgi:hypothetical protein
MWIKRAKIPLTRIATHFALGDLRKFAEQYGDIIQWDQSNRAYIMTHGVSGIDWKHYKHPLPENLDKRSQHFDNIFVEQEDPTRYKTKKEAILGIRIIFFIGSSPIN